MRNLFDLSPPLGNREATREALEFKDDLVALFPSRVIERKNPARALRFSNQLDATMWILGEVEDFYEEEFAQIATNQSRPFLHRRSPGTIHDAYAASDLVIVSSNWEGFGNPVIESVAHRRPLAVHNYPLLHEIMRFGFAFFDIHDPDTMRKFLAKPNPAIFDANHAIAAEHFNIESLPKQLEALVAYALSR
jgi:glycosyltransferase involved in cell wall biosynthesis